jgi:hypothetical protein
MTVNGGESTDDVYGGTVASVLGAIAPMAVIEHQVCARWNGEVDAIEGPHP